jgi:N-acetylglucosaminyl-diphospho-decaprenol L-rhamnosyltransferase
MSVVPKVAVVIPFYGGADYLPALLNSVFEDQEKYVIKIYIVDNSKLNEKLNPLSIQDTNVCIIDAGEGIGYGRACNIGYKQCIKDGVDFLVVVNQDGYFAKGSLTELLNALISDVSNTVAVPLLTKYEADEVEWFFTHVYLTPMTELVSDLFRKTPKSFYPINQLCGACFALRLKDYKGFDFLFDELYHMYFEDADLYERLKNMGRNIILVPEAVFHHTHSNTTNYHSETISALAIRRSSKHFYTLKHHQKGVWRALPGWCLLVFRNFANYLLGFNFREMWIELIAFVRVWPRLGKIADSRKKEQKVLTLNK